MPCNSEHLNANRLEIELSRVLMLIEELDTGIPVNTRSSDWDGYRSGVYNNGGDLRLKADQATATLCSRLQTIDVSKFSLEMQMWWRDHQKADEAREKAEKEKAEALSLRASALSKLTPEERKALGLN
jgi:hypothetical protein